MTSEHLRSHGVGFATIMNGTDSEVTLLDFAMPLVDLNFSLLRTTFWNEAVIIACLREMAKGVGGKRTTVEFGDEANFRLKFPRRSTKKGKCFGV